VVGLRRWSRHYLLILLAATPARAQERPPGVEIGIDASVGFLSTIAVPDVRGTSINAHGGWELRLGIAPEIEFGFASFNSGPVDEGVSWFMAGARYCANVGRLGFFAQAHGGYGHVTNYNIVRDDLAWDFAGGVLVQATYDVSFGLRFGTRYIDTFVPAGGSTLWYELGVSLQLNLRP
jgi:hypothetical protein